MPNCITRCAVGLAVLFAAPAALSSAEIPKLKVAAKVVNEWAGPILDWAIELDKITAKRTSSSSSQVRPAATDFELYLECVKTYPNVEGKAHRENSLFGWSLPGHSMDAKVKVNCEVKVRMKLADLVVERDKKSPDTLTITVPDLPGLHVESSFAKDSEAEYHVNYGWLHPNPNCNPLHLVLDDETSKSLRSDAYNEALKSATKAFDSNGFRNDLIRSLQALLRERFPGLHIIIE